MSTNRGYAGFQRPEDIVADKVLSQSQKAETLLHWKRAVTRLTLLASAEEREAYEALTLELAVALRHIDNLAARPHILGQTPLKFSQS